MIAHVTNPRLFCRCTTVRYSTTANDLNPLQARIVAKKLLEVLIEMNLADNPVLFHIFSNGGSIIYNEIRKELDENPDFEEIDKLGIVYDSAPGRVSISRSAEIMYSLYPQGLITTLMKMAHMFLLSVMKGLRFALQPIGLASILPPTIYEDMMFGQDGCPELYLYSEADEVISYKDVEEIITRRHMQSVDISSKRWLDSKHVQHFRQHPKEYSEKCYEFLSKCLKRSEEGN